MTPPPPTSASNSRPRVRGSGDPAVLPLVPGLGRTPARTRPLPDAAAVRLAVVPDSAPPYDNRCAVARGGRREPPEPRRTCERPQMGSPGAPGPGRDRGPGKEAAAGWPSQFAQVLAETLAGSRSPVQITPWTTDQALRLIRQLGPMLAAGPAPRVRRVLASQPAEGVVEMTVVVGCGPRTRALAVRLEQDRPRRARRGRDAGPAGWVCTAVEAA
jgi:Family of unknown function (DUF6459)